MRKFFYFGLFFLIWFVAIFFARSFDKSRKFDSGCLSALDKEKGRYVSSVLLLAPEASSRLNRLDSDYAQALSFKAKVEIFEAMKVAASQFLVKSDLNNPITRKIIDQIAGAANRFSAISQSCVEG